MQNKLLPRERLLYSGPQSLRDTELLQAILGSGTHRIKIDKLAEMVLRVIERKKGKSNAEDLQTIPGMGAAKICVILAALELGRRILTPRGRKIYRAPDIIPYLTTYADRKQEYFLCASLNGAHEILGIRVISVGLLNRTIVHPREVFAEAISERSAAIILAHNHPSGNVEPSSEDIEVTERLVEAGHILGIQILDHIIFSVNTYYSFSEHDQI